MEQTTTHRRRDMASTITERPEGRAVQFDAAMRRAATEPTLSVYEVASLLGFGEMAVRRAIAEGKIPAIRLGRNVRVPSAHVLRMLGIEHERVE
jgi:excisionase family DNA binding protein